MVELERQEVTRYQDLNERWPVYFNGNTVKCGIKFVPLGINLPWI